MVHGSALHAFTIHTILGIWQVVTCHPLALQCVACGAALAADASGCISDLRSTLRCHFFASRQGLIASSTKMHQGSVNICQRQIASVPCWPNSTSRASAIGDSTLPMEQSFKETNPRSPSLFDNLVILFFTKQI